MTVHRVCVQVRGATRTRPVTAGDSLVGTAVGVRRQITWLVGLLACGTGLGLACGGDEFSCQQDAECGQGGTCQAIGHCSFPDPDCSSGQRFGDNAGSLSGDCVVPQDGTSTTNPAPVDTSTTTEASGGEMETGAGVEDTGIATDSGTEDTDTSPQPLCPGGFFDTFDGNALSDQWRQIGEGPDAVVEGGNVSLYATEGDPAYVLIDALGGEGVDLSTGWVRAEILAVPDFGTAQGTLTLVDLPTDTPYLWLFEGGGLGASDPVDGGQSVGTFDPVAHRWLQLRGDDGDLVYETSPDGQTWTQVHRAEAVDLSSTLVRLTAGHYEPLGQTQAFVVGTFELCPG